MYTRDIFTLDVSIEILGDIYMDIRFFYEDMYEIKECIGPNHHLYKHDQIDNNNNIIIKFNESFELYSRYKWKEKHHGKKWPYHNYHKIENQYFNFDFDDTLYIKVDALQFIRSKKIVDKKIRLNETLRLYKVKL